MFSKAEIQILVEGPEIYRPNDLVRGVVAVQAKKDFEIRSFVIEFSGLIRTTFLEHIQETFMVEINGILQTQTRTKTITHTEAHDLFFQSIELASPIQQELLTKGQEKTFNFEFLFPECVTCKSCGQPKILPESIPPILQNCFTVETSYHLNAYLKPNSKVGSVSSTSSLRFKPLGNPNLANKLGGSPNSFKELLEWKSKLKPLLDEKYHEYGQSQVNEPNILIEKIDEKQSLKHNEEINEKNLHKKIISNPLHNAHKHTRFIRRVFNSHYKSENYNKLVGDVMLEVELCAKDKVIRFDEYIGSKFELILRSNIANLQPEFLLLCNKSSQLGSFVIVKFEIIIMTKMFVSAQGYKGLIVKSNKVYDSSYGYDFSFDVVDFVPNIDNPNIREWHIPMEKLFNNKMTNLIFSGIGPSYECNVLNITHSLTARLSIASNLDEEPKVANFNYDICLI